MSEMWKSLDFIGFSNYSVSNLGDVKRNNKILKKRYSKGYLRVVLYSPQYPKGKSCLIHRLVAQAFIPNPDNLPQVNHKDEDKTNNCVTNLEFCTHKYNCSYGTRNNRQSVLLTNRKDQSKTVAQYTKDGELIKIYPSAKECTRQGYNQGNVSSVCRGESKQAYGFLWKYI